MLVEEIPKSSANKGSTIYFSSSINLTARPAHYESNISSSNSNNNNNKNNNSNINADGGLNESQTAATSAASRLSKNRPKINYNVTHLMNAQTQSNDSLMSAGQLKSNQQIQLERLISKRIGELNKENVGSVSTFEIPKNFADSRNGPSLGGEKKKARLGNTPATKRILSARRNLSLYLEEERNVISLNTILGLSYQFVDELEPMDATGVKRQRLSRSLTKPKVKLCCICGLDSGYARCDSCGLFSCSVRCNKLHLELRCT